MSIAARIGPTGVALSMPFQITFAGIFATGIRRSPSPVWKVFSFSPASLIWNVLRTLFAFIAKELSTVLLIDVTRAACCCALARKILPSDV